jgi:hypothetical protein
MPGQGESTQFSMTRRDRSQKNTRHVENIQVPVYSSDPPVNQGGQFYWNSNDTCMYYSTGINEWVCVNDSISSGNVNNIGTGCPLVVGNTNIKSIVGANGIDIICGANEVVVSANMSLMSDLQNIGDGCELLVNGNSIKSIVAGTGIEIECRANEVVINANANFNVCPVEIGMDASAVDDNDTAVGCLATVTASSGSAFGYAANVYRFAGIAIGANSLAGIRSISAGVDSITIDNGVAVGYGSKALSNGSIAVGFNANAFTSSSTAIGNSALASSSYGIAIGPEASTIGEQSISLGLRALNTGKDSIAIGREAFIQTANNSIAIGSNATVANTTGFMDNNYGSIAVGKNSFARTPFSISIGENARANRGLSMAIGYNARTGSVVGTQNTVAIGTNSLVNATNSIAIGSNASIKENDDLNSISIGAESRSSGQDSIALGFNTLSTNGSICIGANSLAKGVENSGLFISIGANCRVTGVTSTAVGAYSTVTGTASSALGANCYVTGSYATALGANCSVTANNGIAIGVGAVAANNYPALGSVEYPLFVNANTAPVTQGNLLYVRINNSTRLYGIPLINTSINA